MNKMDEIEPKQMKRRLSSALLGAHDIPYADSCLSVLVKEGASYIPPTGKIRTSEIVDIYSRRSDRMNISQEIKNSMVELVGMLKKYAGERLCMHIVRGENEVFTVFSSVDIMQVFGVLRFESV